MRILYKCKIGLSNGIGQMELSCVGPNQNRIPTLGWRKLDPEKGGKQGELVETCTCLECIPKGWLVVTANTGSHDPVRVL
jgi:hypothetical protein